jgi:hypothetical protein
MPVRIKIVALRHVACAGQSQEHITGHHFTDMKISIAPFVHCMFGRDSQHLGGGGEGKTTITSAVLDLLTVVAIVHMEL